MNANKRTRNVRRWQGLSLGLGLGMLGATALPPPSANAAGLYFVPRGVRPLGVAGAMAAGADDVGAAIGYNPAGLIYAGEQFLVDASVLFYSGNYTRQALVGPDDAPVVKTYPKVNADQSFLPLPTLAYSNPFGLEDWNFAVGLYAPYSALTKYPQLVDGLAAPQRYSLISLEGTTLVNIGLYAAWSPLDWLSIGAGFEIVTGIFETKMAVTSCPADRLICAAQDPSYDAVNVMETSPIIAPTGIVGVIAQPTDDWRIGLSWHAPASISTGGKITVQMPAAPLFQNAYMTGDQVNFKMQMPNVVRAGVQYLGIPNARIEVDYTFESWSQQKTIDVTPTETITMNDVAGFPSTYDIGEIQIVRGFQDSNSVALGAEYSFGKVVGPIGLDLRGGFRWEQTGIPTDYLTVATVDMNKYLLTAGVSLKIDRFRLDATYAHVFAPDVFVPPGDAKVPGVTMIRANPTPPVAVNGGTYTTTTNVVGIGLAYQFDDAGPTPQPYGKPVMGLPGHGEYDGVPFGEPPPEAEPPPAAAPTEATPTPEAAPPEAPPADASPTAPAPPPPSAL